VRQPTDRHGHAARSSDRCHTQYDGQLNRTVNFARRDRVRRVTAALLDVRLVDRLSKRAFPHLGGGTRPGTTEFLDCRPEGCADLLEQRVAVDILLLENAASVPGFGLGVEPGISGSKIHSAVLCETLGKGGGVGK